MVEFKEPKPNESYDCKFVRVGKDIHVTEPKDYESEHRQLAIKDGLFEKMEGLDRSQIDAGWMGVSTFSNNPNITVYADSETLNLPRNEKAREETIKTLTQKYPECKVEDLDIKNLAKKR